MEYRFCHSFYLKEIFIELNVHIYLTVTPPKGVSIYDYFAKISTLAYGIKFAEHTTAVEVAE